MKKKSIEHPSQNLNVIGVTGTNGKTTVTHLIGEALTAAGYKPFVLGTLNSGSRELSTPLAEDIKTIMNTHLEQAGTHFVMEVTSEGIDQGRVVDVDFNIKLLTNITQDHLDYHKSFSEYKRVKLSFMDEGDAYKIYPENFENITIDFKPILIGDFNLLNVKAAISVLRYLSIPEQQISSSLSLCHPPKGRMECVAVRENLMVFIDFAHTPDALANILDTAKEIANNQNGRVLALFGCGGNRDTSKRSRMGEIAARRADHLVITDDNPRHEDSQKIIDDIVSGIPGTYKHYTLIQSRREAIKEIIAMAEDQDVVILAGKGHGNYQIVKSETHYFNEREEVEKVMSQNISKTNRGEAHSPDS